MEDNINLAITVESKANFSLGLLPNLSMPFETARSANVEGEHQASGTAIGKSFMLHL